MEEDIFLCRCPPNNVTKMLSSFLGLPLGNKVYILIPVKVLEMKAGSFLTALHVCVCIYLMLSGY